MALATCKECGEQVSTEAKTCPHCGAGKPTARRSPLSAGCLAVVVAVIVLYAIGRSSTASAPSAPGHPAPGSLNDSLSTQALIHDLAFNYTWSKDELNIMSADFTITNKSALPVKDLEITCTHSAPSGTVIDRNVRTIYQLFPPHKTKHVRGFNMGFINSQATRSACEITDLTRAE